MARFLVSPPDVAVVLRKCQMENQPPKRRWDRVVQISSDWFAPGEGVYWPALRNYALRLKWSLFAFFVPVFLLGSKGFEVSKNNGRKSRNSPVFHVDSSKRSRSELGNWWKLPCSASSTFINLFNLALQCLAMHLKTNQGWYQTTNQLGQPVTTESPHSDPPFWKHSDGTQAQHDPWLWASPTASFGGLAVGRRKSTWSRTWRKAEQRTSNESSRIPASGIPNFVCTTPRPTWSWILLGNFGRINFGSIYKFQNFEPTKTLEASCGIFSNIKFQSQSKIPIRGPHRFDPAPREQVLPVRFTSQLQLCVCVQL